MSPGRRLQRSVSLPIDLRTVMMGKAVVPNSFPSLKLIAENNPTVDTSSSDEKDTAEEKCNDASKEPSVRALSAPPASLVLDATRSNETPSVENNSLIVDYIRSESWSDVERLCEEQPDLAKQDVMVLCMGEKCTALNLHLACSNREVPLSVIDALVTAYPSSVLLPDAKRGRLAIHMAVLKGASAGVVRYLAKAMPSCLSVQDAEGNLPIHYAAMCGNSNDDVLKILLEHVDSCKVSNSKGKLPLHYLCARWVDASSENPVSIEIMEEMISGNQAITTCDVKGRLPIHIACNMRHPRLDVIQLLLSYKPETILCRDEDKCTPLQLAKRFTTDEQHDLGVAFLQEVFLKQKHLQQKKKAIRMARRFLHFGRNGSRRSQNDNVSAAEVLFNC